MRGYYQHKYNDEKPCGACGAVRRARHQAEQQEQRHQGRCAPGLGWPLLSASENATFQRRNRKPVSRD